jgi:hypothetical protein
MLYSLFRSTAYCSDDMGTTSSFQVACNSTNRTMKQWRKQPQQDYVSIVHSGSGILYSIWELCSSSTVPHTVQSKTLNAWMVPTERIYIVQYEIRCDPTILAMYNIRCKNGIVRVMCIWERLMPFYVQGHFWDYSRGWTLWPQWWSRPAGLAGNQLQVYRTVWYSSVLVPLVGVSPVQYCTVRCYIQSYSIWFSFTVNTKV